MAVMDYQALSQICIHSTAGPIYSDKDQCAKSIKAKLHIKREALLFLLLPISTITFAIFFFWEWYLVLTGTHSRFSWNRLGDPSESFPRPPPPSPATSWDTSPISGGCGVIQKAQCYSQMRTGGASCEAAGIRSWISKSKMAAPST